jgi:hypothetical protein
MTIQQIMGHWCLVLRPEITKGKWLRRVPIHKHLIEQGLLKYVEDGQRLGKPLFYEPARARGRSSFPELTAPAVHARGKAGTLSPVIYQRGSRPISFS